MMPLSLTQQIAVSIIPILTAITLHEASHAYVAYYFGDTTAKAQGRLTLNPIPHIDLFGTILVPLIIGVLSQFTFIFGWAKPVPISPRNFKNPRRDMVLVTLAGPLSNLIMAFLWAALLKLTIVLDLTYNNLTEFLLFTARNGIILNLLLGFFNLIPLPPLDGSKIVLAFLSPQKALTYLKIEPYGFIILLVLAYSNILSMVLMPFIQTTFNIIKLLVRL